MHTRVKSTNSPDGRQPGHDKSPAGGPGSMILDMAEDVRARIDCRVILCFANWQGDDGSHDERDVEEDAGGLDLGHDSSEEDGDEAVCEDCGYVRPVDDWSCGGPVAVAGDGDH